MKATGTHRRARLAGGLAAFVALLGTGPSAQAAGSYGVDDYPDKNAQSCSGQFGIYAFCVDENGDGAFQAGERHSPRGFAYRNCTDFVAWRKNLTWSGINSNGDGNARGWRQGAISRGYQTGSTPVVGAIAWWGSSVGSGYGHVGVVIGVNRDGTARVEQYNIGGNGAYAITNVRAEEYLYVDVPSAGSTPAGTAPPPPPPPVSQAAFQANTGSLWATGTLGTTDTRLGMMQGTSPSLALVSGGYQTAFQANTGRLWTTGALGTRDLGLGMMPGTSPSITTVNSGNGYQIAFQANTSSLWTTGSLGTADRRLGVRPGSSPSIVAVLGGYQIAFEANTTSLWSTGTLGTEDKRLGMMPDTSPSITAVNNGTGYQIAFQANTTHLWTTGAQGTQNRGLGMSAGSSPNIASVGAGYQIAFQANTTSLWSTGTLGTADKRLGMMPRTDPES